MAEHLDVHLAGILVEIERFEARPHIPAGRRGWTPGRPGPEGWRFGRYTAS
jgi:hypothetical protein